MRAAGPVQAMPLSLPTLDDPLFCVTPDQASVFEMYAPPSILGLSKLRLGACVSSSPRQLVRVTAWSAHARKTETAAYPDHEA